MRIQRGDLRPKRSFTAMIGHEDGWWIGFIEEVPGVNAQEKTKPALMRSLRMALRDILEIQREQAMSHAPRNYQEAVLEM